MGKLKCKRCDYVMSNVGMPNEYEGYLISDKEADKYWDDGLCKMGFIDVWECICGALALDHPDPDEANKGRVKWFYPEDGKSGNYFKWGNEMVELPEWTEALMPEYQELGEQND